MEDTKVDFKKICLVLTLALIGPAAIVLSVMARKEIDEAPHGAIEGRGMAIAGLATGIIGTVIWAAVIALIVATSIA